MSNFDEGVGCSLGCLVFVWGLPLLFIWGVYLNLKALAEEIAERREEKAERQRSSALDKPPPDPPAV